MWVVLEQWSTKVVSLLMFALMTRILGAEAIGLVTLATAFVTVLRSFVDSGFSKSLIQKKLLGERDADTAFWTSLTMAVVLYAVLIWTSPWIADLMDAPDLGPVLIGLGAMLPLSALSRIPSALMTREFAFKSLSLRTVASTVVGALVALPMALLGFGVWALVAQTVVGALVGVIVLWTATPWRPRFTFSWDSFRSLWRTGISLLGIDLLDTLQGQIDKFIVGGFFSVTDLGIYALATRIGLLLQELITTVISRLSMPTFSRIQDDLPRVYRVFRQLSFTAATVSFPVFAMVAVLGDQIIPAVFGPGWEASVPLVWIMAGGWAFASVASFDRGALVGTGHAGAAFWLAFAQNLMSTALVFAFIPFGLMGIAFSRFARLGTWPIRLFVMYRCIKLPVWGYVWQVVRCALATAPAVVGIALLQNTAWAQSDHAFWTFALPMGALGFIVTVGLNLLMADRESREPLQRQVGNVIPARFRRG